MTTATPVATGNPSDDGRPRPRRRAVAADPAVLPLPPATISTLIVCLPDDLPDAACTTGRLPGTLGLAAVPQPRYWATPHLRPWQRGRLIQLQHGRPAFCAGGPVRLLDLTGMRRAAEFAATIRFQSWQQIVHGTRPAQPWVLYLARHLADPAQLNWQQAKDAFYAQPRVSAMRISNAVPESPHIPVGDLETLQAGGTAYQHYSAMTAICGDALLTAGGRRLIPASDALADRVTYLEQAVRHLQSVHGDQRLLALTVHG